MSELHHTILPVAARDRDRYQLHKTLSTTYPDDRLLWRMSGESVLVQTSTPIRLESYPVVLPVVGDVREFRLSANPTVQHVGDRSPRAIIGRRYLADWLARKGAVGGFEVMDATSDGPHYTTAKNAIHGARFGGVEFQGVLRVTDAGRFTETIRGGIGRAKAFGFGLLVVGSL